MGKCKLTQKKIEININRGNNIDDINHTYTQKLKLIGESYIIYGYVCRVSGWGTVRECCLLHK